MRVPAKPLSITTLQVVSRISLRRSATVGFFTASNAIAATKVRLDTTRSASASATGGWRVRIEDPDETGRVHTDGQLFEDANSAFSGSIRPRIHRVAQCLHVQVCAAARIFDRQTNTLAADDRLALPHPVAELRVPVAEATHQELLPRLEGHRVHSAVRV